MPKKAITASVADLSAAPGGAAAVDRAITILHAFSQDRATLTLTELSEVTGLYKSTVLRLLASLEHGSLIRKTAAGYQLGSEVARLFAIYSNSFSLETVVVPALEKLVRQTRESAAFHVLQQGQRICLFRVESPQLVREHIKVGDMLPLTRGAGARVLMAFTGAEGELYDTIRRDGVIVLEKDRSPEISGVSAPVFSQGTTLAGAVTLTMPAHRLDHAHAPHVLACAQEITALLGGHFPASAAD